MGYEWDIPSGELTKSYWTWPSRNSGFFSINSMVIFHGYVSSPEGKFTPKGLDLMDLIIRLRQWWITFSGNSHLCVCLCDEISFYIVSMGYKQCIEIIISTDPICCESAMSKIPNHGGCGPTMGHRQTASQKGLLLFGACYWAAKGDCACRLMLIIGFLMNPLTL